MELENIFRIKTSMKRLKAKNLLFTRHSHDDDTLDKLMCNKIFTLYTSRYLLCTHRDFRLNDKNHQRQKKAIIDIFYSFSQKIFIEESVSTQVLSVSTIFIVLGLIVSYMFEYSLYIHKFLEDLPSFYLSYLLWRCHLPLLSEDRQNKLSSLSIYLNKQFKV